MASGKPILVIGDKDSEISLCVKEFNIGWVAQPNNPKMLARLFDKIYTECVSGSKNNIVDSRDIAVKYFAKELILNKYLDLFDLKDKVT